MATAESPRKFWHATAEKGVTFYDGHDNRIRVYRVAKDRTWADIHVTQPNGAFWSKRQPLNNGRFPFFVTERAAS